MKEQHEPQTAVSYTINKAIQKEKNIEIVEIKQQPLIPIKRPKKKQEIKLKKGKTIIDKYIILKLVNLDLNQKY